MSLQFVKLSSRAVSPRRYSEGAAGLDLSSAQECIVPAGGNCLCDTDLQIALPPGCYGRIAPRSGLASKYGIDVGAGVIDRDYRGHIKVLLFNFGKQDYRVNIGDRIAQLICEKIVTPPVREVPLLNSTIRGDRGFGSSGYAKTQTRRSRKERR